MNSTINVIINADLFECLFLKKMDVWKCWEISISQKLVFIFWALSIRFGDHGNILISSEKMDVNKKRWISKCKLVILVCFVLYIDVLSVSMRFSVIFCMHEHIQKYTYWLILAVGNIEKESRWGRIFRKRKTNGKCNLICEEY